MKRRFCNPHIERLLRGIHRGDRLAVQKCALRARMPDTRLAPHMVNPQPPFEMARRLDFATWYWKPHWPV